MTDQQAQRLPELLEANRLVLRRWVSADAPALSTVVERNIEHLRPWMPWIAAEPLDLERRVALIESWERSWVDGGDVVLGMFKDDLPIGSCGLHRRVGPDGLEIGYWVDRDHTNQGLATEATGLLTSAALSLPSVTFVEIHHDKANIASRGVPERLGYAFLGETSDGIMASGEVGIDWAWRMTATAWFRQDRTLEH